MAFSAFVSWTTPTTALAMRMRRITTGSTKAPKGLESVESSKRARRKETAAEARRIRTSWSLNWSRTRCHRGVGGSSGSSGGGSVWEGREMARRTVSAIEEGVVGSLVMGKTGGGVDCKVLEDLIWGERPWHIENGHRGLCQGKEEEYC